MLKNKNTILISLYTISNKLVNDSINREFIITNLQSPYGIHKLHMQLKLNMMERISYPVLIIIMIVGGCSKDIDHPISTNDIWDIEKDGIPKFVEKNYNELNNIYRILRYRSSIGHDYSDATEQCRSMKHYFEPKSDIDWSTIKIYSPVTGIITRVEQEWSGTKIEIASDKYPAFRFSIFHINT
jgi:hypothetical protein